MTGEARAICQALLDHHRAVVARHPPGAGTQIKIDRYLIAYGDLCQNAAVSWLVRKVGPRLLEVAKWCRDQGYPPLNSLAVNATTRVPGDGYDGAGGFKGAEWPAEVESCVRWRDYPSTIL